jgi:hypothetical protein
MPATPGGRPAEMSIDRVALPGTRIVALAVIAVLLPLSSTSASLSVRSRVSVIVNEERESSGRSAAPKVTRAMLKVTLRRPSSPSMW